MSIETAFHLNLADGEFAGTTKDDLDALFNAFVDSGKETKAGWYSSQADCLLR